VCGETGQRAGREAYRGPHPQVTIMLKQTYVSFYRPRSQVFNEVAEVLEMVDSKGAGWMEKAAKMEEEAKARISEIKRQIVL